MSLITGSKISVWNLTCV